MNQIKNSLPSKKNTHLIMMKSRVKTTSTSRKVILEKTGIMGGLVHLKFIVKPPQWCHHPVINIQLVLWVVIRLMLVMVKVMRYLVPPTLPPIKSIDGLMVEIFCDLIVWNIHP